MSLYFLYKSAGRKTPLENILVKGFGFDPVVKMLINSKSKNHISSDEFICSCFEHVNDKYINPARKYLVFSDTLPISVLRCGIYPRMKENDPNRLYLLLFVIYFVHCYLGAATQDSDLIKNKWSSPNLNTLEDFFQEESSEAFNLILENFDKLKDSSMSLALELGGAANPEIIWNPYACKFIGFEAVISCLLDSKEIRLFIEKTVNYYLYGHGKRLDDGDKKGWEKRRDKYFSDYIPTPVYLLDEGFVGDYEVLGKIIDSDSCIYSELSLFSKFLSIIKCVDEESDVYDDNRYSQFIDDLSRILISDESIEISTEIKSQLDNYIECIKFNGLKYKPSAGRPSSDPRDDPRYWYWGRQFSSEVHDIILRYSFDIQKNAKTIFLMHYKHGYKESSNRRSKSNKVIGILYNGISKFPSIGDIYYLTVNQICRKEYMLVNSEWYGFLDLDPNLYFELDLEEE